MGYYLQITRCCPNETALNVEIDWKAVLHLDRENEVAQDLLNRKETALDPVQRPPSPVRNAARMAHEASRYEAKRIQVVYYDPSRSIIGYLGPDGGWVPTGPAEYFCIPKKCAPTDRFAICKVSPIYTSHLDHMVDFRFRPGIV